MAFSAYGRQQYQPGDEGGLRPSTKPLVIPEPVPDSPGIAVPPDSQQKSIDQQNSSSAQRIRLDCASDSEPQSEPVVGQAR
jgi:hypothetical protein